MLTFRTDSGRGRVSRQGLLLSAALAVVMVALSAVSSSADVTIRYKFNKGEVTNYVVSQTVNMAMKLPQPAQSVTTRMQQQMFIQTTVDDVLADGSSKQRMVIRRLVMKTSNEGVPGNAGSFEYDSASEEKPTGPLADVLLKSLEPLVGAEWKQTISPLGKVSDIEIPEKVVESLKSNPGAAMMGSMATADGLKQISSQSSMAFPEEPLSPGKTWESTVDLKLPFGTMATKKIMKYIGPADSGREKLSMETDLSFVPNAESAIQLKVVDNESEGDVLFDTQRGRLERSKLHQVTTMQVAAGGQTIDQVVTTDVLFEIDESAAKSSR